MLDLSHLNPAQYEAVTAPDGPMLVVAGAGSGKTRTIVHRLAWLVEQGRGPDSMLLLTFTRKAAQEMLERASLLLGQQLAGVQGGTFHAFAFSVLRRFPPSRSPGGLSVMDATDASQALKHCKDKLGLSKGDRAFPRAQAVLGLLSKARNKEMPLEDLLHREAQHVLPYAEDLTRLGEAYQAYRREHALLDYDDLLFELEQLFLDRPEVLELQRARFRQVMVDEYQDTNKVQARLVRLLATCQEHGGNVMAVGDDAQSIYAFRGATIHNILDFPKLFPGTRVVRLEENYRSVQPVLDVANAVLEHAPAGYAKHLFSRRPEPEETRVRLFRPFSDLTQGQLAARRIEQLLETWPASEIAVLFRAGYQSYHLEVELNKRGVAFRKYGGLRYTEAAHVRDVLAFARLAINPLDLPSFERVAGLNKGVGPRTAHKLYSLAAAGQLDKLAASGARYPAFLEDLALIDALRRPDLTPDRVLGEILDHYRPKLESLYPDDWPRRWHGLEEMLSMASGYDDLSLFVGALALDSPEEEREEAEMKRITLSTVHSAKGLEWGAVLILDLVEERFPSRHALARPDDYEEERRLLYVACTRAKDSLDLFVPLNLYQRGAGGQQPASPSPFVREIGLDALEEWYESYGGPLQRRRAVPPASRPTPGRPLLSPRSAAPAPADGEEREASNAAPNASSDAAPVKLGFCTHRVFGRGKIVEALPPDKFRVHFPGMGLKVIMAAYLSLEDA